MTVVELVQGVRVQCHRGVVSAVKALGRVFEAHDYVVRQADTGGYNCRAITNGVGHSLHAYGIAIDLNWNSNPFRRDNVLVTDMPKAMLKNVKRIRTNNGKQVWGWGGDYTSVKDAMHFEIVCTPADHATGIDWDTVYQSKMREEQPHRWPLVQRGDRGPAVEKLHDLLGVASPGDPGYGTFGPKTERVVRAYQRAHGLDVDGRVGRQTWAALLTGQPEVAPDKPGPVKRQATGAAAPVATARQPAPLPSTSEGGIMSESVFKGAINPGSITAEFESAAANADADLLVAAYAPLAGGGSAIDEDATEPGGSARVNVRADGRGVLEVWVAIGAASDRGTLRVLRDGDVRNEEEVEGSVRWVYSVQAR